MGKGRKTRTLPLMEKSQVPWTVNMRGSLRNLTKDKLGSVIFGCKNHTIMECLDNKIFGLPASHHSYVKNVSIGLRLYLFNYSDRKLHGIFEAVSAGQQNINQYAWAASEGVERTPYPSQVRVRELRSCRPLHEEEFKPIIASNYYTERLFWFELDHEQDQILMKLFLSSLLPKKVPRVPNGVSKKAYECLSRSNVEKCAFEKINYGNSEEYSGVNEVRLLENEDSFTSFGCTSSIDSGKKWSELFKPSSSSCVVKSVEDFIDQNVELLSSAADCFDDESKFVSSADGWNNSPREACMSDCDPCGVRSSDGSALEDDNVEEIYDNEVPYSRFQDPDSAKPDMTETSLENRIFSDEEGESVPLEHNCLPPEGQALIDRKEVVSETDLQTVENCERSQDQLKLTDKAFQDDKNAMPAELLTDVQSSDNQELITKLMQEVGVLKLSQVKQRLRIESLENDLLHSKVEIDQLKSRDKLDSIISSTRDQRKEHASLNFILEEPIFIVGGFNGSSWLSDLSLYSPSKDHVISLCPMTFTRSHASLAKLNGELYIFGGAYEGVWYDTVESYNSLINQWIQRPSLNRKKGYMAGVSMYETIFSIGGGNGVDCFDEVELFDQHIGCWICTKPMLEKRLAPAAANLNGALYVAGGYDGRNYLRSVERFDPRQHVWSNLSGMNLKRGCHSLIAFNDKLYALGGYDGDTMVSSVEVLDPRNGSWMMVEPMKASRGYFCSFALGGQIYVIGGVDDEVLDMVECYNEDYGWHEIGKTALGKRSFFSAII